MVVYKAERVDAAKSPPESIPRIGAMFEIEGM